MPGAVSIKHEQPRRAKLTATVRVRFGVCVAINPIRNLANNPGGHTLL